jgi:hypothetical protein
MLFWQFSFSHRDEGRLDGEDMVDGRADTGDSDAGRGGCALLVGRYLMSLRQTSTRRKYTLASRRTVRLESERMRVR